MNTITRDEKVLKGSDVSNVVAIILRYEYTVAQKN